MRGTLFALLLLPIFCEPSYGQVKLAAPKEWKSSSHQQTPEEKAKAAELKAREEYRQQRIEDKVQTLGEHRRAEAQRLIEMEEASRKARGLSSPAPATAQKPTAYEPTESKEVCHEVSGEVFHSTGQGKTRAEAEQRAKSSNLCGTVRGPQIGVQISCSEQRGVDVVPTVVDGKTVLRRVPKAPVWTCSMSYSCSKPKQICKHGSKVGQGVRN